ncbi:13585_t:CDS:2 [Funneliformis mosseae]|uniref:13585_t:CDS:1 n=1 Tax=Funneliformis mosseae TaxID=27381 RepID=A0A9N8ZKQ6_FUNMO|nr:13585_t:CDS:2 [Funneliformis mosseae]
MDSCEDDELDYSNYEDYLQATIEYPDYNLSPNMKNLFNTLLETCKNVFNTGSAFYSRNKNEAILGLLMIHLILQYLANAVTGHAIYVPLLGMKVDSFFESFGEKGLGLYMIELSEGYLTFDMPYYLKNHMKGYWGCHDLLNNIITKYNHGNLNL